MAADSRVIFSTELDESGLKKGLNNLKGGVSGLAAGIGTALGNIGATVLSGVVTGLVENAQHYIDVASDLNEVQNVVDTTFGDSAEEVNNFATAAKEAYGMSELKAKQFTSTMGAMLKSMGMTEAQTLGMSTSMTGLAGDMASFYNLDYDTAFEKLRSGISGETEPLKQLGINMSVANLEAYALAQGITTSYNRMTQAQQATLRYNYLMSVTADAQGDFARTSDGYSNQQRILATTQEELAATIGEILLPIALKWTETLNDMVGGIKVAVEWVGNLFNPPKDELQKQIEASTTAVTDYSNAVANSGKNLDNSLAKTQATQAMATSLLKNYAQIQSKNVITESDTAQLKTIAQEIVTLYPDMGAQIDTTTGLFNANTTAIQTNINKIADQAKAMAYYAATQEYQTALLDAAVVEQNAYAAYDAQYQNWLDKDTKLKSATGLQENLRDNWASAAQFAGQLIALNSGFSQFFTLSSDGTYQLSDWAKNADYLTEINNLLDFSIATLQTDTDQASASTVTLKNSWDSAAETTATATENLNLANDVVAKNSDLITYNTEHVDENTAAVDGSSDAYSDATVSIKAEDTALKQLQNTLDTITESTARQIDSQVSGFDKVGKVRATSTKSTISALKSQQKYLEDYQKNLELAKTMGYSEEVISALSDGSTDSASKLAGLVKANETQITQVNGLYENVTTQKGELTETLTQNNLEYKTAQASLEEAMAADVTDTTTAADTLASTSAATAESTQADATSAGVAASETASAKTSAASDAADVKSIVQGMTESVGTTVEDAEDEISEAGAQIVEYIADGVEGSNALQTSLSTVVKNASSRVKSTASTNTYSIGGAMTSGVANGIRNHASSVQSALQKVIDDAIKAIKRSLGIASPSKLMRDEIGAMMAKGVGVGFSSEIVSVIDGMSRSISRGAAGMKTAIDTSLIGRVSQIGGIGIDGAQISALAVNSATYGVTGPASGASGSSGYGNVQNTYNFYQPVTTPDEVARAIRRQTTYGLAGARA